MDIDYSLALICIIIIIINNTVWGLLLFLFIISVTI